MKLSKTNYLVYRGCAHNAWVKMHMPEIYRAKPLSVFDEAIIETGNDVDVLARDLFPAGVLVERGDAAGSMRLISQHTPILYQPVFETDLFTVACDILVWNRATQSYDLFEVKASTSGDDKAAKDGLYAHDLAFQALVLRENGVPLGGLYLVRLDSTYVSDGTLALDRLFTRENFSVQVALIIEAVRAEMHAAYLTLQRAQPLPAPCSCIYKGRSSHCTTFAHSNPDVPEYSIHDLARIGSSKKKLAALVDSGVLTIEDIPDGFHLTDKQRHQVHAAKTGEPFIDRQGIATFLAAMDYPISFLDYETYPCALPRFAGYSPFHQIPFQFSLHVVEADGTMRHSEFLFTDRECPDAPFVAALEAALTKTGTIVAWNQAFEKGINTKLGERLAQSAGYLSSVNARIIDLMELFAAQMYVHPAFRGKTSIKYVLPALVPELSYKGLAIQEGGTASETWNKIVTGQMDAQMAGRARKALLSYCGMNSLAMVEIWRVLREVAA
ncbi:DUF2779 domain-containing protein [Hyphomicrobium sp. NDB2Meth4]|uniref:DUF2779 domain-containing protein n=1 Tax=Hyphomicrobium sp. NDB2Meth4 TaxID=1892846 RepID=UPI0009310CF0|nr:DUF2779 domain-containing protein [Hyphomicrobium sp. NDB2Meth4]